ncbi:hypothetical protein LU11_gp023 [Pseudomonas phage Lu11]|uniref:hypothetical protein n=1 Tax=Pseudomonas phage Lu11 TaxID=1161927 RepID=UPI00025F14F1|nr:hypothetical protein LU11_gp023 [Pseudomonas phage Lu11]AFH14554.1 hypothetical protein Lu11_0023 [Pseudomonas phage Lu11]
MRDSILLTYEQWPEQLDVYFIPASADIDEVLLTSLKRADGVYFNSVERQPKDAKQEKAAFIVQAAVTVEADHLDQENQYKQNRFHAMLVPFKVREYGFSSARASTIRLIRTGILL